MDQLPYPIVSARLLFLFTQSIIAILLGTIYSSFYIVTLFLVAINNNSVSICRCPFCMNKVISYVMSLFVYLNVYKNVFFSLLVFVWLFLFFPSMSYFLFFVLSLLAAVINISLSVSVYSFSIWFVTCMLSSVQSNNFFSCHINTVHIIWKVKDLVHRHIFSCSLLYVSEFLF